MAKQTQLTFPVISDFQWIVAGSVMTVATGTAVFMQLSGFVTGEDTTILPVSPIASLAILCVALAGSLAVLTWQPSATVDRPSRTITWKRRIFGLSWISAIWTREEIEAIEITGRSSPHRGYVIDVRSDKRRKRLYECGISKRPTELARVIAAGVDRPLDTKTRPPREKAA